MLTILPSIIHGSRNDELLRLFECIESIKSEVKQKMMNRDERNGSTKVTEFDFQCFGGFKISFLVSSFYFSRIEQVSESYRVTIDTLIRACSIRLRSKSNLET